MDPMKQKAALAIGRLRIGLADGVRAVSGRVDRGGRDLLAHELTHLVQQRAGQSVTMKLQGVKLDSKAPLVGQQLDITMKDATGRNFGVTGKIKSAEPSATMQDWTIVYETIQRVY